MSSRVWLNESAHTSAYGRPLGSRGPLRIGESAIDEAWAPPRLRAELDEAWAPPRSRAPVAASEGAVSEVGAPEDTASSGVTVGTEPASSDCLRAHAVKVPDWRAGMPRRGSRPMMRKASERRGATDMTAFATAARPGTRAVMRVRRGSQPSV